MLKKSLESTSGTRLKAIGRIGLLTLLLIVFRLPFYYISAQDYDAEEAITGNLAQDLNDGLVLPAPAYQYVPFAHGPLVLARLMAPLYRLLGDNYLTLKLTGLLFSLAIFLVWFRLIRTAFGPQAAWRFAVLFLICPPGFLENSLHVFGNHYESILFAGLILLGLQYAAKNGFRKREALLLGLIGGFASFFCYQGLVPLVLAVVLFSVSLPRNLLTSRLTLCLAGFIVGFLPSVVINLATGEFYQSLLAGAYPLYDSRPEKIGDFFLEILPGLSALDHSWTQAFYLLIVMLGWLALGYSLSGKRRRFQSGIDQNEKEVNLLPAAIFFFPLLWSAVYLLGNWDMNADAPIPFRYAVVLFPFIFAAVAAPMLFKNRILSWLPTLALVALVLIDGSYPAKIGRAIRSIKDANTRQAVVNYRGAYYHEFLVQHLKNHILRLSDPAEVQLILAKVSPQYRTYADELWGLWQAHYTIPAATDRDAPVAEFSDQGPFVWVGLGQGMMTPLFNQEAIYDRLVEIFAGPQRLPDQFWIGVGVGFAEIVLTETMNGHKEAAAKPLELKTLPAPATMLLIRFDSWPLAVRQKVVEGLGRNSSLSYVPLKTPMFYWRTLKQTGLSLEPLTEDYLTGYGALLADWAFFTRRRVPADFIEAHVRKTRMRHPGYDLVRLLEAGYRTQVAERKYGQLERGF